MKLLEWGVFEVLVRESEEDDTDQVQFEWMTGSWFEQKLEQIAPGPGDQVLDIGAHTGGFALLAAYRGCSVLALEPEPSSSVMLRVNAKLNALQHRIHVKQWAVGGEDGEVTLQMCEQAWGHTTHANQQSDMLPLTGAKIVVPMKSLKTILDYWGFPIILAKVNVEGAEFDMIRMASVETLRQIRHYIVELHFDLVQGTSLIETMGWFLDAGFTVEVWSRSDDNRAMIVAHREDMT